MSACMIGGLWAEDNTMFDATHDEINEAHARARERIAVRVAARLPALDHDQTVADALTALVEEKRQIAYAHWKDRLWQRWHRRVEKMIERKTGQPFRFTRISGHAVQRRWLAVLGRFVRLDVERRFGRNPVSLSDVSRAYEGDRVSA